MPVLISLAAMLGLSLAAPFWGWVMIVPFVHGMAAAKGLRQGAMTGLLAAGLLWLGAGVFFYFDGGRTIAGRLAAMFGLGRPWTMIAATALVAALAGGLSGFAGAAVRAAIVKNAGKERP